VKKLLRLLVTEAFRGHEGSRAGKLIQTQTWRPSRAKTAETAGVPRVAILSAYLLTPFHHLERGPSPIFKLDLVSFCSQDVEFA